MDGVYRDRKIRSPLLNFLYLFHSFANSLIKRDVKKIRTYSKSKHFKVSISIFRFPIILRSSFTNFTFINPELRKWLNYKFRVLLLSNKKCSNNFHAISTVATSTRNRNCRWSSLFIHTKTSYKGQPLPFLPISQIRTPSVHRCFLMVDQIISLSLSLSLTTRLRANYTGERKRRDGREDERLRRTAKTRCQATHVTVSIAHYLRSIEQTATLLPLVSRLHAHRPPPPRA